MADSASVHARVLAVLDELPAIGKEQRNPQQGFMYRGHDDVMNALNPLLAKHGVIIVPDVIERVSDQRATKSGGVMYEVNLHVRFTFFGAGGDSFTASTWGEGTDSGDKSTNKAMTHALKNVVAQVFALATQELSDADAETDPETTGRASLERAESDSKTSPAAQTRTAQQQTQAAQSGVQLPGTWAKIEEMIKLYDDTTWEAWLVFAAQARTVLYGEDKPPATELRQLTARVAKRLLDSHEPGLFPPPTRDEITDAWSSEVETELAGPVWRMTSDETDRVTLDEYQELDKK